jgi:hypothetical protein
MKLNSLGRGGALSAATAVAGLSAALVLVFSVGHSGQAHASTMSAPPQMSAKAVSFVRAMDKLWEDHITWTRIVIIDFAAGLPDLRAAEARLLRNQADIGNAIKPYYGTAAGNKLTQLLRTHILEAVPVLADAKSGNKAALTKALTAWHANAHQIALLLAQANPHNWTLSAMDTMMRNHLALTTKEGVARIEGHWAADIAAYDQVHNEILQMSHMLAMGIIAQFPNRF